MASISSAAAARAIDEIIGNWKTSGNLEERSGYCHSLSGRARPRAFPDDGGSHPSQRGSGRESDSAGLEGQLQ